MKAYYIDLSLHGFSNFIHFVVEIVPTSVSSQLESTSVSGEPLPTSVPGDRDMCSEELCGSAVVGVSAVSLLLILTLTTVILTQPCT